MNLKSTLVSQALAAILLACLAAPAGAYHVAREVKGSVADPRVAVEYASEHEKAGSIRMYETLPLFCGRSTLEGVYNQASLQTHAVYYLASELDAVSPNPFKSRAYSTFDTDNALRHLRLFNVSDVVAVSPKLVASLQARTDVAAVERVPPYTVFRLADHGPGYVEPMAFAPVRSSPRGWRDKAYRWFTRKPLRAAHLVFTEDTRFTVAERDEWLPPPEVALDPGVTVRERVDRETVDITTSRIGHPLLVKISYHPRWRAEGADGPYLVSPALMMVVPREANVRLVYARTLSDHLGAGLTLTALLFGAVSLRRRRVPRPAPEVAIASPATDACDLPAPTRRWGGAVPSAVLLVLFVSRFAVPDRAAAAAREAAMLEGKAAGAQAEGRFADAAEYARHGAARSKGAVRSRFLCLRAENLVRGGQPDEGRQAIAEASAAGATCGQPIR